MIRIFLSVFILFAPPAFANHPGEHLDEAMAEKEPAFEALDLRSVTGLEMIKRNGGFLQLGGLRDQVVVISFVPQGCGGLCISQQAVLAAVQKQVNIGPMKELVSFLTVHNSKTPVGAPWEGVNWKSATPSRGTTVAAVATDFAELSNRKHTAPMVHIIDRNKRHAGIFHGADFRKVNLILYINGLINNAHVPKHPSKKGWWERLKNWF